MPIPFNLNFNKGHFIDYGNVTPFDTTAIRNTMQSMTNLVHALGFKTKEEEEEEKRKKEEERRKAEFGHAMLSVPAVPGDAPAISPQAAQYYFDGDVEGAKAIQTKQDAIGTTATTMSLSLPYSFSTIGTIPTLLTEAASAAGGVGGYKLGEVVDNKLGTKVFAPTFSFIGGMGAGVGSYKGLVNLGTKGWLKGTGNMYGTQFKSDVAANLFENLVDGTTLRSTNPLLNVGWAPKQTIGVRRAGDLTEMYYPQRWDVVEEGANPFGVWLQGKFGVPRTDITDPGKGTKAARARAIFASRPQYVGKVSFDKPMTVLGDVSDRSALSHAAEQMGADGIIYNGYYDNGYNLNQGVFSFIKPELSRSSGQDARIMWMGPTTGKTTYAKTNNSIVDIDPLTKSIRKDIASKLGLDFRSPEVSESPEYQEAVVKMINGWLQDPSNHGKTMVASTKFLLDPKYGIKFANEPFMPDFNTFVARNQARGFRETPEQLRKWYDSILAIKPDIKISNDFASDVLKGYAQRPITYFKTATYPGQPGMYNGKTVPTWQLPKGQRNQLYTKGYRVRNPQDIVVNFEKEKRQIIDLFNSKEYRDRLIADGYTPEEVDNFVNQMVLRNGKFERTPAAISERVGVDRGTAGADHILVRNYNPEIALHEFGHITQYPRMWTDPKQPKITKLQFPYAHKYYLEPGEIRTRALGVLQWMQETGKTIDDFYTLPNDYNFGSNERAFEFFNAYPEVQGRNYLMHFRKQGGSIPKLKSLC